MEVTDNDNAVYSGITSYEDDTGYLEVAIDSMQFTNSFSILSTEFGPASGYYAPPGELEMTTTSNSFEGSGTFIITNSSAPAPANGSLKQVGKVYSVGLSNSISAVHNVGFNIPLSSELQGLDASQLNLYGWDETNKTWQLIPGGTNNLGTFSIALISLDHVSYALFAPPSDDTEAPSPVTELQANTGTSRWWPYPQHQPHWWLLPRCHFVT